MALVKLLGHACVHQPFVFFGTRATTQAWDEAAAALLEAPLVATTYTTFETNFRKPMPALPEGTKALSTPPSPSSLPPTRNPYVFSA